MNGMAGNDTLSAARRGQLHLQPDAGAANADSITDFAFGADKIHLDGSVMNALGAPAISPRAMRASGRPPRRTMPTIA